MPYYNRDPKRYHNVDNHPYRDNGKEIGNYYKWLYRVLRVLRPQIHNTSSKARCYVNLAGRGCIRVT